MVFELLIFPEYLHFFQLHVLWCLNETLDRDDDDDGRDNNDDELYSFEP